jgi:Tol biopolymer transport system component
MGNFLKKGYSIALVCVFLLTGCGQKEPVVQTKTQTIILPSITVRPSQTMTLTVSPTYTPTRGLMRTSTPLPTPIEIPTLTATPRVDVTAPAGIAFGTGALWVIKDDGKRVNLGPLDFINPPDLVISPNRQFLFFSNSVFGISDKNAATDGSYPHYLGDDLWLRGLATGEITNLTNNPSAKYARQYVIWSPDSRYIFYCNAEVEGGNKDIWVVDVRTGGKSNLTRTPNIDESRLGYWPGPNRLIFTSRADGEDGGPFNAGHLSTMRADGNEYQVLSNDLISDLPVVSPDGRTLADRGGYLIRWGEDTQKIDFKLVDSLPQREEISLETPAWSPDGRHIAWSVLSGGLVGVGLYDLAKNELKLFHFSEAYPGEGFSPAPSWSPDGKWLSWDAWSQDIDRIGLWIIQPETGQEIYLGKFHDEKWSPDSHRIAFEGLYNPEEANSYLDGVWVADVGSWTPLRTDLPSPTELLAWYDPAISDNWMGFPHLWVGNFVTVTASASPLALRSEANQNAQVIISVVAGKQMEVVGGPVIEQGVIWWKMRTEDGTEGWSAENEEWYEILPW